MFRRGEPPPELPEPVRARLDLHRGDRVLAAAADATGRWWVAARSALVLVGPDGGVRRLAWEQIEHAEWDRDDGTFTLVESGRRQTDLARTRTRFDRADHLLEVIRDLVSSSVVLVRTVPLPDGRGEVVVSVRRRVADGSLFTHVSYGAGLDPDDPTVRAAGAAAAQLVGAEVGL